MIYLIGCDHRRAQTYPEASSLDSVQAEFRDFLIQTISTHKPNLIAEEHHPETLRLKGCCSIAREVAEENHISHRFCDPSLSEKHALGIGEYLPFLGPCTNPDWQSQISTPYDAHRHDIAHRWPIREDFWINMLDGDISGTTLFICGALHICSFSKRLQCKGVKVEILEAQFGVPSSTYQGEEYEAFRAVQSNNFPPEAGCFCVQPMQSEVNNIIPHM